MGAREIGWNAAGGQVWPRLGRRHEQGQTVALIVAAGSGSRAGGEVPKQYRPLAGKPLLAHALDHLRHPADRRGPGGDRRRARRTLYRDAIGDRPLPAPVIGGATRQQSVRNGLEALAGGADRGADPRCRPPLLPAAVIDRLLDALDEP